MNQNYVASNLFIENKQLVNGYTLILSMFAGILLGGKLQFSQYDGYHYI